MPLILFHRGGRGSHIPADPSVFSSSLGLAIITALTMALLLSCSVSASAATYTIQFGDAGGLVIEYEVTTKSDSGSASTYSKYKVSGTLNNATKLPIRCAALWPIIGGRPDSSFGLIGVRIDAGASRPFSSREQISGTSVSVADISGWKAESCFTPLEYEFVNKSVTKNFSAGVVTGNIGHSQIGIAIENNSDQPIEIAWNDSSFSDIDRSEKRIFHSGVEDADREQNLPNSTIPPLSKVEDAAIPTANVLPAERGGWRHLPLLPTQVRPESFEKAVTAMHGAKLALLLQLVIAGKKTSVVLVFEVAAVKPGTFKPALGQAMSPQPEQAPPPGQPPNGESGK